MNSFLVINDNQELNLREIKSISPYKDGIICIFDNKKSNYMFSKENVEQIFKKIQAQNLNNYVFLKDKIINLDFVESVKIDNALKGNQFSFIIVYKKKDNDVFICKSLEDAKKLEEEFLSLQQQYKDCNLKKRKTLLNLREFTR